MASAEPILPKVVDDHIGEVHEDLERANSTYGEREEFRRAGASLVQASSALTNASWVIAHDEIVKAKGGLETGKAKAQANGSGSDSRVVDHGRQLASQARSEVRQVRDNLGSMERTGLEPVAFSGGLTAAYVANRAMDLLRQYQIALDQWEQGNRNDRLKVTIVSSAAGATVAASMASQVLSETVERRANATADQLLSTEDIDALLEDRVAWAEEHSGAAAQKSRERMMTMVEEDERLMALSAFTLYYQDVAFNGLRIQQQRGNESVDAYEEARDLYKEQMPSVEAWIEELDVPGDIPIGAMESTRFTLVLNHNASGSVRDEAGAYAVGLAHLGIEQTGLLQQAYGAQEHDPGTDLAEVELASEEQGLSAVPAPGALLALAALAFAVLLSGRRDTR